MTDGERKRWEHRLKMLQVAVAKCPNGTAKQAFYASMAMVLGAVLGDPVYEKNFAAIIDELKSFNVDAMVSDPRQN